MSRRSPLLAVVAALALTGCITGERPTLSSAPSPGGNEDEAAAAVLERLERAPSLEFTATYLITPTGTGREVAATVAQVDGSRRIVIGDVTYIVQGGVQRTCVADECDDFLDDARVSDLNVTHRFWGDAFASRLRLDSSRRTGFSDSSPATIAGQPALCARITVPSLVANIDSVEYCALDAGVLARYVGADVAIELTSFSFTVDGESLGI